MLINLFCSLFASSEVFQWFSDLQSYLKLKKKIIGQAYWPVLVGKVLVSHHRDLSTALIQILFKTPVTKNMSTNLHS